MVTRRFLFYIICVYVMIEVLNPYSLADETVLPSLWQSA
jgi:hypothetical protein